VAEEVSRAKTLWPVALRSLEARLDDAVHGHRRPEPGQDVVPDDAPLEAEPADDLLAGLRDSLQAMETVAAEMTRASDTLGETSDDAPSPDVPPPTPSPSHPEQAPAAAAGGATIVPLRTGEP
jgi:hypothetical protein